MIEIRECNWLPEPGTRFFPDWRQRLARNLNRPSTGKWEPLSYEYGYDVILMNKDSLLIAHPKMMSILKNVGLK